MRMRFLAVMSASALVLAVCASAAYAQAVANDDSEAIQNTEVQYIDCSQVQNVAADQQQSGDADATANDESEAAADISQELNISQEQVNACLGQIGAVDEPETPPDDDASPPPDDDASPSPDDASPTPRDGEEVVIKETVLAAELPETGGPLLLPVVLGTALVMGGILAGRAGRGR